jgi:hypothetical protein
MRYHYEKPDISVPMYGENYYCERHPVYFVCTLYKMGDVGLAVIQQKYRIDTKSTWWTRIDPDLRNSLYLNPGFLEYFKKMAGPCKNGCYPTVTIRQIMWALKMKPLKREPWETCFDHCPI